MAHLARIDMYTLGFAIFCYLMTVLVIAFSLLDRHPVGAVIFTLIAVALPVLIL